MYIDRTIKIKKRKRKRRIKDDQPYKVGKPFVKWLKSQIKVMEQGAPWHSCHCGIAKHAAEASTYRFIRGIVKS